MAGGDQQNDRPQLTAHRDEFRRAIEQEMDAATKAASSDAVPLRNGRRVAQVGGAFQYHFDLENNIVTKAHADRSQRELQIYRRLERALTEWGMGIIHKQRTVVYPISLRNQPATV